MSLDGVIREKRGEILRIAAKYGAHNIRVFGSLARGEANETSDVDLLVEFEPGRSLLDHSGLKIDLQELLGFKVDVVEPDALHWVIRDDVLNQAIPL